MSHEIKTTSSVWHTQFGLAIPALKWVPAPRYLLRRDLILKIAQQLPAGNIVELGCGAGALLGDLARLGFKGVGVDQSETARRIAEALLHDIQQIQIVETHDYLDCGSFDYLAAFEVLEHIEDDHAALDDWAKLLKPGGTLIVSVPAHPERWNPADVWAGHYRRYRREDLSGLIEKAGFELQTMQSYGYPLANIMERLSARIYARQTARRGGDDMKQNERTEESGSDRSLLTKLWPVYSSLPGTLMMKLMWRIQRRYLDTDHGIGYLAVARKL